MDLNVEASIVLGSEAKKAVMGSGVKGCIAASMNGSASARKEALTLLCEVLEERNPDIMRHRIAAFVRNECCKVELPTELSYGEIALMGEECQRDL